MAGTALTSLDLGNIYMVAQAFLPQIDYPDACGPITRFTFALLVHTFYFCPAGTMQLQMVRHPRSLVVGGGWDDKIVLA